MKEAEALFIIAAAKKEAKAAVETEIKKLSPPNVLADALRDTIIATTGPTGAKGERGPQGMRGPEGPRGPKGEQGPKGERGEQGPKGDPGKDGRDGKDGADGVGVASVEIDDGILTVSLTDGRAFAGDVRGPRGPKGERGPKGDRSGDTIAWVSGSGGGGGSTLEWSDFVTKWSSAPTLSGSTDAGAVYAYTLDGVTRYRLVPDPYDPALDGFYSGFTGGVLSGLITTRG